MLNRSILTLPAKAKARPRASPPEPAIDAQADPRVRYPLLRSLWPTSRPESPVVAKVRHRTPTPLDA